MGNSGRARSDPTHQHHKHHHHHHNHSHSAAQPTNTIQPLASSTNMECESPASQQARLQQQVQQSGRHVWPGAGSAGSELQSSSTGPGGRQSGNGHSHHGSANSSVTSHLQQHGQIMHVGVGNNGQPQLHRHHSHPPNSSVSPIISAGVGVTPSHPTAVVASRGMIMELEPGMTGGHNSISTSRGSSQQSAPSGAGSSTNSAMTADLMQMNTPPHHIPAPTAVLAAPSHMVQLSAGLPLPTTQYTAVPPQTYIATPNFPFLPTTTSTVFPAETVVSQHARTSSDRSEESPMVGVCVQQSPVAASH